MKHHKFVLSGLLVLLSFLLAGTTTVLASGNWYVDGVHGSDSNNCKTPQTACKTIGHAISLASSGDTISVAAATYYENLTINMSLTIHGDFATSAPTIIDGGGVNTVVTIPNAGTNVTLSKVTIRNGNANDGGGGVNNKGTLTVTQSSISGNNASLDGSGGIYNSGGTLTVTQSTINGNIVTLGGAGGIYNSSGTLMVSQSAITGNGGYDGGGINNKGTATLTNSTVNGNTSYDGGGIYNAGTLTITNSTISGNFTGSFGGGVHNDGGKLTIGNSTVSGNSAPSGGGMAGPFGGTITVQNTIVANSPSGGNCLSVRGSIKSNGYNLSSDGTCPFNNTGDLNNTDPKLGPLQNNGGPTQTQALLTGSPAIDAGNPSGCTDGQGNLLKTDQRGAPRPDTEDLGVGCDMGAYEEQKGP